MKNKFFATAKPAVTDDDGEYGYLWEGIIYDKDSKDFIPTFKTNTLYYSPTKAIAEVNKMYKSFLTALNGKILNLDDPTDFNIWMQTKEEWLNNAWKEACKDIKPL